MDLFVSISLSAQLVWAGAWLQPLGEALINIQISSVEKLWH